jgi:hypothetical protein
MIYKLPNGKEITLEDVVRISKVRDKGEDSKSIEYSIMSFTIYLGRTVSIDVEEHYHFADWSDKKLKLNQLRTAIVDKCKEVNPNVDDS